MIFFLSELCLTAAPVSTGDFVRLGIPGEDGGLGGEIRGAGGMTLTVCARGRRRGSVAGVRVEKTVWALVVRGMEGLAFGGGGRGIEGGRLGRSALVDVRSLTDRGIGEDSFLVKGEARRISMTGASGEA